MPWNQSKLILLHPVHLEALDAKSVVTFHSFTSITYLLKQIVLWSVQYVQKIVSINNVFHL